MQKVSPPITPKRSNNSHRSSSKKNGQSQVGETEYNSAGCIFKQIPNKEDIIIPPEYRYLEGYKEHLSDHEWLRLNYCFGQVENARMMLSSEIPELEEFHASINRDIEAVNKDNRSFSEDYAKAKSEIEERFKPQILKEEEKLNKYNSESQEAEAKVPDSPSDEKVMQGLTEQDAKDRLRLEELPSDDLYAVFEQIVRLGFGAIIGISLAMLLEAIDPNRLFELATFIAILFGFLLISAAGEAIKGLSARFIMAYQNISRMRWQTFMSVLLLLLMGVCAVLFFSVHSASDVVVMMQGIFRSIATKNIYDISDENMLNALYVGLACMICVIPYMVWEAGLGWDEGRRQINRILAREYLVEKKEQYYQSEDYKAWVKDRDDLYQKACVAKARYDAQAEYINRLKALRQEEISNIPVHRVIQIRAGAPGSTLAEQVTHIPELDSDKPYHLLRLENPPMTQDYLTKEENYARAILELRGYLKSIWANHAPDYVPPPPPPSPAPAKRRHFLLRFFRR